MPGYRVGVFRKRFHYRPHRRRMPFRTPPAVVGEECRAELHGTEREVFPLYGATETGRPAFPLYGEVPTGYETNLRQPFILYGVHCREDV